MTGFRGDYQLKLYNPDGTELAVLDMRRIEHLYYERMVNDIGQLNFTLDASDSLASVFGQTDTVVDVWRRNAPGKNFELEDTYLLRYWNRFEDENSEYLIYGGPQIGHLMKRRIIIPADDPLEAGGYSSKYGAADTVMYQFANEQCINPNANTNRAIPNLIASAPSGTARNVFQRRQGGDSLFDTLQECSINSALYDGSYIRYDWHVRHNGDLEFEFVVEQRGSDKTERTNFLAGTPYIVFNPERGNMISPSLTLDRKTEETIVWVGGRGLADQRILYPVSDNTALAASPWNRIEGYVDSRSDDDTNGLIAAGQEELDDKKLKFDFDFTPDLDGFQGRYNEDWVLGDFVTGYFAGYSQDVRISAVAVEVDNDEGIQITLENQP